MRTSRFFRHGILVSAVFFMNLAKPASPLAEETPRKSLYERLGGVYNIAPVVVEFLEVFAIVESTKKDIVISPVGRKE